MQKISKVMQRKENIEKAYLELICSSIKEKKCTLFMLESFGNEGIKKHGKNILKLSITENNYDVSKFILENVELPVNDLLQVFTENNLIENKNNNIKLTTLIIDNVKKQIKNSSNDMDYYKLIKAIPDKTLIKKTLENLLMQHQETAASIISENKLLHTTDKNIDMECFEIFMSCLSLHVKNGMFSDNRFSLFEKFITLSSANNDLNNDDYFNMITYFTKNYMSNSNDKYIVSLMTRLNVINFIKIINLHQDINRMPTYVVIAIQNKIRYFYDSFFVLNNANKSQDDIMLMELFLESGFLIKLLNAFPSSVTFERFILTCSCYFVDRYQDIIKMLMSHHEYSIVKSVNYDNIIYRLCENNIANTDNGINLIIQLYKLIYLFGAERNVYNNYLTIKNYNLTKDEILDKDRYENPDFVGTYKENVKKEEKGEGTQSNYNIITDNIISNSDVIKNQARTVSEFIFDRNVVNPVTIKHEDEDEEVSASDNENNVPELEEYTDEDIDDNMDKNEKVEEDKEEEDEDEDEDEIEEEKPKPNNYADSFKTYNDLTIIHNSNNDNPYRTSIPTFFEDLSRPQYIDAGKRYTYSEFANIMRGSSTPKININLKKQYIETFLKENRSIITEPLFVLNITAHVIQKICENGNIPLYNALIGDAKIFDNDIYKIIIDHLTQHLNNTNKNLTIHILNNPFTIQNMDEILIPSYYNLLAKSLKRNIYDVAMILISQVDNILSYSNAKKNVIMKELFGLINYCVTNNNDEKTLFALVSQMDPYSDDFDNIKNKAVELNLKMLIEHIDKINEEKYQKLKEITEFKGKGTSDIVITFKNYKNMYPENYEITKECLVCLESYQDNENIKILVCGHDCHESCLISWFKTRKEKLCPYCGLN